MGARTRAHEGTMDEGARLGFRGARAGARRARDDDDDDEWERLSGDMRRDRAHDWFRSSSETD